MSYLKLSLPNWRMWRHSSVFSYRCIVLGFIFLSKIHFDCVFWIWFKVWIEVQVFCIWISSGSRNVCEKIILFPVSCLCTLVENEISIAMCMWLYFWVFHFFPLVHYLSSHWFHTVLITFSSDVVSGSSRIARRPTECRPYAYRVQTLASPCLLLLDPFSGPTCASHDCWGASHVVAHSMLQPPWPEQVPGGGGLSSSHCRTRAFPTHDHQPACGLGGCCLPGNSEPALAHAAHRTSITLAATSVRADPSFWVCPSVDAIWHPWWTF